MLVSKVQSCQLVLDRILARSSSPTSPTFLGGLALQLRNQLAELASLAARAEQELAMHRDFVDFVESEVDFEGEEPSVPNYSDFGRYDGACVKREQWTADEILAREG